MADSACYQRGLELAEAGNHRQALEYIEEHLKSCPDDPEALNDAGAILHCLGRSTEAIQHLLRAKILHSDSPEIVWNLVEAYLAAAKPAETADLFDNMERLGILNADVLNRTATAFLNQNNKADAVETLLRSLQLSPSQHILEKMIDTIKAGRPTISFLCGVHGNTKFLTDICDFAGRRFHVRVPEIRNMDNLCQAVKDTDICWFEWCTDVVVEASKLPKVCKNIVRLHRFEAYAEWPSLVRWENIDVLILVGNSFVKDALLRQVPDIVSRTTVITIPNGVNLDRFRFAGRPRGKNIACIGHINMRKNPMFLLQCMQKLHYIDPAYRLYFAGDFQEAALEQYVRHMVKALELTDVVFFDGWQQDINAWLGDKHYIVSGSVGESQGMGLLEAMACGLKPVIHNFPGADEIFPVEFVFNIAEEFCRYICSDQYEPQRYRTFVEDRYPLREQLGKINDIFIRFENELASSSNRNIGFDTDRLAGRPLTCTFQNA